jgi:hypothetical protein
MVELSVIRDLVAIFGVIAGFSYYVLTVRANKRNQQLMLQAQQQTLVTRQAQFFMQIYNQSHNDPSFITAISRTNRKKINSYEEYVKEVEDDQEFNKATQRTGMFYEGLGVLVKEGYLDIKLVALLMTGMTRRWWENQYQSWIADGRVKFGFPRWMSESEYLFNELMKYTKEHPELAT